MDIRVAIDAEKQRLSAGERMSIKMLSVMAEICMTIDIYRQKVN